MCAIRLDIYIHGVIGTSTTTHVNRIETEKTTRDNGAAKLERDEETLTQTLKFDDV